MVAKYPKKEQKSTYFCQIAPESRVAGAEFLDPSGVEPTVGAGFGPTTSGSPDTLSLSLRSTGFTATLGFFFNKVGISSAIENRAISLGGGWRSFLDPHAGLSK